MAERATIARPYAKAAFAAAREQGRLAEWSRWLGNAREVVLSEEFRLLESSPGVVAAAITNGVPLAGLQPGTTRFQIQGKVYNAPEERPTADVRSSGSRARG